MRSTGNRMLPSNCSVTRRSRRRSPTWASSGVASTGWRANRADRRPCCGGGCRGSPRSGTPPWAGDEAAARRLIPISLVGAWHSGIEDGCRGLGGARTWSLQRSREEHRHLASTGRLSGLARRSLSRCRLQNRRLVCRRQVDGRQRTLSTSCASPSTSCPSTIRRWRFQRIYGCPQDGRPTPTHLARSSSVTCAAIPTLCGPASAKP